MPQINSQIMKKIDIYKSTLAEIRIITGLKELKSAIDKISEFGVRIIIVTKGKEDAILFFNGKYYLIPSIKTEIFQDSTGAGDVFIGAFLAEYIEGKNPIWCGCVGSSAASLSVRGVGPSMLGEKEEIYHNAVEINRSIKEWSL
jgi:2-dehydro-3-deoxygluconokinase